MNIENVENLLNTVWEKRLWVICSGVFIYSFSFFLTFYTQLPEERATIKEFEIRRQHRLRDESSIESLAEEMRSFAETGIQINENMGALIQQINANKNDNETLQKQNETTLLAKQGLERISEARKQLASIIGTSRGTIFQSTLYTNFFKGYSEELEIFEDFYSNLQSAYFSYISGARTEYASHYAKLLASEPKYREAVNTLPAMLETSALRAKAAEMEAEAMELENRGIKKRIQWRLFFAILFVVYDVMFLVIVCHIWRTYTRKRSGGAKRNQTGVVATLDRFIEEKKAKKLWGVGSVILVWSIWFIVNTIGAAPEEAAKMDRFLTRADLVTEETNRMNRIIEQQYACGLKSKDALLKLQRITETHYDEPQAFYSDFRDGYDAMQSSRQELSHLLGVIKGSEFITPAFTNLMDGLEEAFRNFDSVMSSFQELLLAVAGTDKAALAKRTKDFIAKIPVFTKAINQFGAKIDSFKSRASTIGSEVEADFQKEAAAIYRYIFQLIAIVPLILYQFGFAVIIVRSWKRYKHPDVENNRKKKRPDRRSKAHLLKNRSR